MLDELLHEILLNSDLATIKNLFRTNKRALLHNNGYFWHFKYKKENINFDNMKYTLDEYEFIHYNFVKINLLMSHNSLFLYGHNLIHLIQLNEGVLSDMIEKEGPFYENDSHILYIDFPNLMHYRIIGNNRLFEITHELKNVKLLLSKIFYFYPHIIYKYL